MSEAETCDLCGLPVPKDGLHLRTPGREMAFCCEGCKGIWQMLNPGANQAAEPARPALEGPNKEEQK